MTSFGPSKIVFTLALVGAFGTLGCKKQETTSPDADAAPPAQADADLDTESDPAEEAEAEAEVLTKTSFENTVSEHFDDVSDCYMSALEANPELAGELVASFTIGADGQVTALVAAEGSTLTDEALIACITERAQSWGFDTPTEEMVLQYPFNLEPAE
ncbi:AgmX/PglI C-terminal domain-containing protein [Pseudenhygromyxa sp. WMMC2535]|uniref:AgmX/PglI C-terminal domain-containing protein n=1 Tax=Pseudenhygromyxa sp. WMMC2535 TaxID=2712867 RepID=UPI001557ACCD|nr:AgmX/PglI C-terminal domain-containing protein [Pseudenhygromyxa sp. WMMC2535]NVB37302.1 AgmX/PglI C-terminal domain-containing protein [Pseudenhygromyxa sp. WMMC2535]